MSSAPKVCLTIAGLDPSGGAGIIADIKTFTAFGCYAAAAIASITYQNTTGVFGTADQTAEIVRRQVQPIIDDMAIDALKTGMLPTREVIDEIARLISENSLKNIVIDPVVRSTSGFDLIDDDALRSVVEKLFPLADIITPNLPEAERISGISITTEKDIENAAKLMQSMGARNVLIKGGHLDTRSGSRPRIARDSLFTSDGVMHFDAEFIDTDSTHGTGCTLAAGIAANLAHGHSIADSLKQSKRFVTEAIRNAPDLGRGHSPVNHLIKEW